MLSVSDQERQLVSRQRPSRTGRADDREAPGVALFEVAEEAAQRIDV
jgi:hypothetical protein